MVTRSESLEARLLLQSRSSIVIVEVPPTAKVLAETYTCELYSLAVPAQLSGGVVTATGAEVGNGANVGNGVGLGRDGGAYSGTSYVVVVVSPNTSGVSVGHGVAEIVAVVVRVSNPVMVGFVFAASISAIQRLRSCIA